MRKFENKIIHGDCIELLSKVKEPFVDLIFADPPFNIGYQYDKYKDTKKKEKYIEWTKDWIKACYDVLKPSGSFYIAIGDDYAAHVRLIGEEIGLHLRNWIIWHYTFGQQTKNKFARAHTHIFYFVKDKTEFTFNDFAIRVPSDRQLIYNDKRADSRGKMPDDVWNEYSRVCGTFKERQGWHPCQMPENLLARIISASSKPGDLVLDPFSGSGTTAAVALMFKRRYAGMDISADYVKNAKERLSQIKNKKPKKDNLFLSPEETSELKRLCVDIGLDVRKILGDEKLLNVLAKQLTVRMNNGNEYADKAIATALVD